jgi:ABC-type transport system substrate-binding protein
MKKLLFIVIALVVVSGLMLAGCGGKETTPTPTATTQPTPTKTSAPTPTQTQPTTQPTSTSTPTPTETTGVYGGTLKIIATSGAQMLSYVPQMGPGDRAVIFPAAEALVDATSERGEFSAGVEPVLCDAVDVDADALTITFHIRKNVYFSDGSELTAEVAQWNLQQVIDAGAMPYIDYFKDFRSPDKYTLIVDLTSYNNQMMPTWGWWTAMYSKEAWDKASGGDLDKGIEWARTHIVGTGPFILESFTRDVSMVWVKNPNYWRPGRPYLDRIEVSYIPDAVTARAAFEAGEGDIWGAPPKDAKELMAKGYVKQSSWPVLPWGLWPNTANPDSIMSNLNLREAVEYAIDKSGISEAIGQGFYNPLPAVPPQGEWGYDASHDRAYNPDKAKELLADEGYSTSNPCKINLLTTNAFGPTVIDACTAVKQNLDAVGFEVTLDVADAGRFFGTAYGKDNIPAANQDLLFYFAGGAGTNYLQTYVRWFSSQPFTWISYLGRTDEQVSMDEQALGATDMTEQQQWTKTAMDYMWNNCLIIPIYGSLAYVIQQPYVHSTEYTQGFIRWQMEEIWMDKH